MISAGDPKVAVMETPTCVSCESQGSEMDTVNGVARRGKVMLWTQCMFSGQQELRVSVASITVMSPSSLGCLRRAAGSAFAQWMHKDGEGRLGGKVTAAFSG